MKTKREIGLIVILNHRPTTRQRTNASMIEENNSQESDAVECDRLLESLRANQWSKKQSKLVSGDKSNL